MYCKNCGKEIPEHSRFCPECGTNLLLETPNQVTSKETVVHSDAKSKLVAVLLGLFLGAFGIHNFYLGYTVKGIVQLLLTTVGWIILVGPFIASAWSFIEAILILVGSISTDASGELLKD